jgi:phospholipid transport system substrate-binding protein
VRAAAGACWLHWSKWFRGHAAFVLLLLLALSPPAAAADAAGGESVAFIRGFVERAGALAKDESALDAETLKPWRALIAENLDMPAIARFVVGPTWRTILEGERSELTGLIEGRIAELYARRARDSREAAFAVLGTESIGPSEELISSRLIHADGTGEEIDWRVGRTSSGLRILDIVGDGQSLAAAARSECTAILQRNRGDVRALIQSLRLRPGAEDG